MSAITVRALSTTPVKGTRLQTVDRVLLDSAGARGDRRFYLIDGRDRMVNAKQLGELTALVAKYSEDEARLQIAFPDDRVVEGPIRLGETVSTSFYSDRTVATLVDGPWSGALSDYVGQPLRLVQAADGRAVDRGADGGVTLISSASLQRLAEVADRDFIDPRRFRMLIEVQGLDAHAEDGWVGRSARVGEARIRFHGHVGRCLITSRDPDTGQIDIPTLDILGCYRRDLATTEPLPFGIYGAVIEPGAVRVGDPVLIDG
ncbi:MAG TPA: MOSC N-terminal beta barrel domain-containing protein [Solirubrobacteraceae bacterium]|nr:MOSC N-terminal beta barrel domain-containing protein [Solirubrobacteraceae bacterium]